jgi:hypothetical protein
MQTNILVETLYCGLVFNWHCVLLLSDTTLLQEVDDAARRMRYYKVSDCHVQVVIAGVGLCGVPGVHDTLVMEPSTAALKYADGTLFSPVDLLAHLAAK